MSREENYKFSCAVKTFLVIFFCKPTFQCGYRNESLSLRIIFKKKSTTELYITSWHSAEFSSFSSLVVHFIFPWIVMLSTTNLSCKLIKFPASHSLGCELLWAKVLICLQKLIGFTLLTSTILGYGTHLEILYILTPVPKWENIKSSLVEFEV